MLRLRFGAGGGDGISRGCGRGRAPAVSPPDFPGVEVDVFGGEFLVESGEFPGDFDLLYNDDTRADLPCHHLQRLQGLLQMPTGESDKEAIVGYSEFVASLAAALKEAPFELSDEASEPSRSRVYELEFVLDITLRMCVKSSEYRGV
jgi:hypothetical protein